MALSDCSFTTDRLVADDWSRLLTGDTAAKARDSFVVSLLTDSVTRDLPPDWHGPYDPARAASWFVDRQEESTVLLVVDQSDGRPVGLLILSESVSRDRGPTIRLGYILQERVWGRGLATELVGGLAAWCRSEGTTRSLIGGVAEGNDASARVLTKNGFRPHTTSVGRPSNEAEFILMIAP